MRRIWALGLAALLTVGATGAYRLRAVTRQLETLERQQLPLDRRELFRSEVARNRAEGAATRAAADAIGVLVLQSGDAAFDARARLLLAKIRELRRWLDDRPDEQFPEMRFLDDSALLRVVSEKLEVSGEDGLRSMARALRLESQYAFFRLSNAALREYARRFEGQLPGDFVELAPYFVVPVDEAVLRRYEMAARGRLADLGDRQPVVRERVPTGEDRALFDHTASDTTYQISMPVQPSDFSPGSANATILEISRALEAYAAANQGRRATEKEQLRPYLKDPAVLETLTIQPEGFSLKVDEPGR